MAVRILFGFVILSILGGIAIAGEYHNQDDILCSDCHTSHYSQSGIIPERAEPGGPFPSMLLTSSINTLCLSCHDGTDPDAPDVLAPVTMYNGSGSEYSAAGYFTYPDNISSPNSHDLGADNSVPFSSPTRSMRLSCVNCHNPHGSVNYRNLNSDPDSSGMPVNFLLDIDVFENNHPAIPPSRTNSIAAYRSANIGYKANLSRWCTDCHTEITNNSPANQPAHFNRHPSDISLDGIGNHASPAHWLDGTGEGFGQATGDPFGGIPRLRFQSPDAVDFNSAKTTALNNQVFCGTCHFAHGGSFDRNLTWPYNTPGADLYSGCQQCHYK
jgi:hypothetical protein